MRFAADHWKTCACLGVVLLLFMTGACTTIPVEQREPLRQELNQRADSTIDTLVEKKPELKEKVDASPGYFVGRVSAVKAPVVGGGTGLGVLYDKEKETRTYMNINRFDLGFGIGKGAFSALALFEDRDSLDKFVEGKWTGGLGAEAASKEDVATALATIDEGVSLVVLPEEGGAVTATARLVKLSVNRDLTDTGVSEVNIPNKGFKRSDKQGEDAPRKWDRAMPFMAQKVIDKGYDLPLPYGIGMSFVKVNQEMYLGALEVGINGGAKEPFEFVSFENANSDNTTIQLKLDTWLFPFMNVFGMIGSIEGQAPLDVLLDGNGMLDQLGITCGGPGPPNPLCTLLQGKTITLPIEANYTGTTYGVGTLLAGGWNNWFVTIPITFTYADMDTTNTEGVSTTVAPRGGRTFNVGRWGNLSLYAGGNYLNTELTIRGSVTDPSGLLNIDYTIKQKNKDNWNILAGGNWAINKKWSIAAEYGGFIGSREMFVTSLGLRF